jgi:hypothetical protein
VDGDVLVGKEEGDSGGLARSGEGKVGKGGGGGGGRGGCEG